MKRIKIKHLLVSLCLIIGLSGSAQNLPEPTIKTSPNGYFDDVYDQYGNIYKLSDLKAGEDIQIDQNVSKNTLITCDTGIFELYFETDSGMENTNNATHNARRAVVCQVFKDLSNFINTPLKNTGNITKVKIWVRNIANLQNVPSIAIGLATSFYTMPNNIAANFGGIVDGEVYKTIQGGKDSYINTVSPLINPNGSISSSGNFYHGMMAFNFTGFTWNTDTMVTAGTGQLDLYTVILHEVTHALGFNSLLKHDGTSVYGNPYKYYSRYDRFLKNKETTQFLITNPSACSVMYNYKFNSQNLTESVLHPGCLSVPPISDTSSNLTNCNSAIQFVGTNTIPVYTSTCYEGGSSFSHFEDLCIAAPNTGNDTYFVMSNVSGTGATYTKHFLKPEERNALIDIGYSLKTTYGNNSIVVNSEKNYGGSEVPLTNYVAGINDGISASSGIFSFIGNGGTPIPITGLLSNDYNATSFECLQDVYDTTVTLSGNSGGAATTINFTSTVPGLHLLRYVSVNAAGKRGNITYVYVYVNEADSCAAPTCNIVLNGDFEQNSDFPANGGQITKACGWRSVNTNTTPDYLNTNAYVSQVDIPCNFFGSESDRLNLNGYAGILIERDARYHTPGTPSGNYFETIRTRLPTPLTPNTNYSLSFDISLAEGVSANAIKFQAYLSPDQIVSPGSGSIPISNQAMLYTSPTFSTTTNGWERITFNITTGNIAGEQFLYLGALNNTQFSRITPANLPENCSVTSYNTGDAAELGGFCYYYVDNVTLLPLNGAALNLPSPVCTNMFFNNLTHLLSAAPNDGVFSGNGVEHFDDIYSFNATTAGVGTHEITYTYTNDMSCVISLVSQVTVVSSGLVPTFSPVAPICSGDSLSPLPTTSTNTIGITGVWSPALNNTATTTYTFTPNAGQCATTASLTITVLPVNNPSCMLGVCQPNITLSVPETGSIVRKTTNWITTNTNYATSVGQDIKLKSGDYIYMQNDTHIKGGSLYLAKIEECTSTSKTMVDEPEYLEKMKEDVLNLYPNPTNGLITVAYASSIIKSIMVSSMDGKTVYTNNAINTNSYLLNASNYKNGIYILMIETMDGKIVREKLIKN